MVLICSLVAGLKVIGHNIRQFIRFCKQDFRRGFDPEKRKSQPQGVSAPISANC